MSNKIVTSLQQAVEKLCEQQYSSFEKNIFSWVAEEFCLGYNLLLLSHDSGENSKLYNSGLFYEVEDYNTVNDFLSTHFSGETFEEENYGIYHALLLDTFHDKIFSLTDNWFSIIYDSFQKENILDENLSLEDFTNTYIGDLEVVVETALVDQLLFTPFQEALLIGLNHLPSEKLEQIDYSVYYKEIFHRLLELKNELFITLTGREIEPITFVLKDEFVHLIEEFRTHDFVQKLPNVFEALDEFIFRSYLMAIIETEGSIIVREFTPLHINKDDVNLRIHKMYGIITEPSGYSFIDKYTLEETYEGITTPNEKMVFCSFES